MSAKNRTPFTDLDIQLMSHGWTRYDLIRAQSGIDGDVTSGQRATICHLLARFGTTLARVRHAATALWMDRKRPYV